MIGLDELAGLLADATPGPRKLAGRADTLRRLRAAWSRTRTVEPDPQLSLLDGAA